jgi:hypothetical protein
MDLFPVAAKNRLVAHLMQLVDTDAPVVASTISVGPFVLRIALSASL